MKKKALFVLFALLLFMTSAYAKQSDRFSVNATPVGLQIATSSKEGQDPVHSYYGIGTEFVYKHHFTDCFFVEGGLGWDTFLMANEDPEPFTNLIYFGGFGYRQIFNEHVSANAHVDIAGDTLLYDSTGSETISVKFGANCEYSICDTTSVSFGCDGVIGFAELYDVHYVNYRILPMFSFIVTL